MTTEQIVVGRCADGVLIEHRAPTEAGDEISLRYEVKDILINTLN